MGIENPKSQPRYILFRASSLNGLVDVPRGGICVRRWCIPTRTLHVGLRRRREDTLVQKFKL